MHNIETLNKLLKNELSATETYQQAVDKLKENATLGESEHLQPVYEAHKDAVSSLQALIHRLGGIPCEDSGAWGTWAKIVLEGANMLGKKAALKALQEGEKSGAEDYEKVLQDTELSSDVRALPGSRYFCESFYGHPCPTNKDRLCERSEPQSYPVVGQARR